MRDRQADQGGRSAHASASSIRSSRAISSSGAVQFAREAADRGGAHPKTRARTDKLPSRDALPAMLAAGRELAKKTRRNLEAPRAVIDAIEAAATLPVRRRLRARARHLRRLREVRTVQGAHSRVLRRTRRVEGSRRLEGCARSADQHRGDRRRRNHGRRHRHGVCERRPERGDQRHRPRAARRRACPHPLELRHVDEARTLHARKASRSASGGIRTEVGFERCRCGRSRHRGGVREHGPQEGDLPEARCGSKAGRHPRHQHLHTRHRPDRRRDGAAREGRRPALLQPGERDAAAGNRPRRQQRPRQRWRRRWRSPSGSARSASLRATRPGSSATG